jgi:hypothetical protein
MRTVAGPVMPPSAPPSPASLAFVRPPELAVEPPVPVEAPPLAGALPPAPPLDEPLAPPLLVVAPVPVPFRAPPLDAPPLLDGAPSVAAGTPPSPSVPSDELPLQPIETTPAHAASCASRRFTMRPAFPHAHDRMDIFQP